MAVVHFHPKFSAGTCRRGTAVQLELFDNETQSHGIVAYVDVAVCNQERLFSLITQKSVRTILDIRCSKVFEKPFYDHKRVCDYFSLYNIQYTDLEIEIDLLRKSSVTFFWQLDKHRIKNSVRDLLTSGPCMVLFDRNENGCEVERFRNAIGRPVMATV